MNAPENNSPEVADPRGLPPADRSFGRSRLMPIALLATGVCAAVYGASHHRIRMVETHQEEFTVAVPVDRPMPRFGDAGRNGQPRQSGPPVKFVKRKRPVETPISEFEPAVNRAVAVGRIMRTAMDKLVLAPANTKGPAFCPT